MYQGDNQVTCHIDSSNHEHQCTLGIRKDVSYAVDISYLQIHHQDVVDDKTK